MPDNPQPTRYRQRPNECDAIQWTGHNADALRAFAGIDFATIDPADRVEDLDCDAQLLVEASHWVGIKPGDWVLKFEGYFIAKDDVPFRAVWEPAAPAAVPSAPADRAAILRGTADAYDALIAKAPDKEADPRYWQGVRDVAVGLRALADEAQQPETQTSWTPGPVAVARAAEWASQQRAATDDGPPAPLRRAWDDCPGFPEQCPNLRPVDPDPPTHLGGIRCGCADKEATS